MRVGILGCGAIGGALSFYLQKAEAELWVVGRPYQIEALKQKGLVLETAEKKETIKIPHIAARLASKIDVLITTTKIYDIKDSFALNQGFLKDAYILTTQNGIGAEEEIAKFVSPDKIFSGIVMFGATFYQPDRVVLNFKGRLLVGSLKKKEPPQELLQLQKLLSNYLEVVFVSNIEGAKYTKLLINLNNALVAVLGLSMQEAFSRKEISRLAIMLLKEAGQVLDKAGITLESLPDFPKERITAFFSMPLDKAAGIYSQVMTNLSGQKLYGSILQSLKRGRPTEVDYINGAIVRLADKYNQPAPLNKKITELVKAIEAKERGFLSQADLLKEVKCLRPAA